MAFPPLPDDAWVVRGGIMLPQDLDNSINDYVEELLDDGKPPEYALSVFSLPGASVEEIIKTADLWWSNKVRYGTVGAVRYVGYDVIRDNAKGHSQIRFAQHPTIEDYHRLHVALPESRTNPFKRNRR